MSNKRRADDDQHQWEPSSSEDEEWGDGEWEVSAITQDYVNTRGDLRFNISWGGWKRDDGSNSTWELQGGMTMQDLMDTGIHRLWTKSQEVDLLREARSSTVSPFSPSPCREVELDEDEDATDEKKTKPKPAFRYTFTELAHQARQMAVHLKNEDDFSESSFLANASEQLNHLRSTRESALQAMDSTVSDAPKACLYGLGAATQETKQYQFQKKTPLHHQMKSLYVSRNQSLKSPSIARTDASAPIPAKPVLQAGASASLAQERIPFNFQVKVHEQPGFKHPSVPMREARPLPRRGSAMLENRASSSHLMASVQKPKQRILMGSIISSAPASSRGPSIPIPPSKVVSLRDTLQARWSKAIQRAGAASVTFVDDFDEESAPVHDITKFTYLESGYIFFSVPKPDDGFMESCNCSPGCTASLCSCQDDSEIQNDDEDSKAYAYDAKGLFAFHDITSYVVECNQKCVCDANCRSRVAQRPRKFPIEIFRTKLCGWGVRSTVALPKGSVLGIYTGEIIPRSQSSDYSINRGSYVFDLDFMKRSDSIYSVDAYNCGNWTRFVNHSCSPVCILYPVVWDSVPSMHQPKLAFVANTDIPAFSELTIDYDPKARKGKGKAKKKIPGSPDCHCGDEDCRGFIYTA